MRRSERHYLPSSSRCFHRLLRDRQLHRLLLNCSTQLILPLTRHDFLRTYPARIKLSLLFLNFPHPNRRSRSCRPPRLTTTRLQRQIGNNPTLTIPHRKRHTRRRNIHHPSRLPTDAIFNHRIHTRRPCRQRPIRRERDVICVILAQRDERFIRHLRCICVAARAFLAGLDGALRAAEPGARIDLVDDGAESVVVGPDAHAAREEAVGAHELARGVEEEECVVEEVGAELVFDVVGFVEDAHVAEPGSVLLFDGRGLEEADVVEGDTHRGVRRCGSGAAWCRLR
ncbi:hypothetical protein HBH48_158940 [Parastagonospora nodorum]|nr:hypothetical protein HBH48_158940 [Parastagonospora nodorum]